jgi:UDP-N-acetylglucosamine 4,6-dehydratase
MIGPRRHGSGSSFEGTISMETYRNTVILVTGGTGSFGNALVRHLGTSECPEIRILSRDETKQDDMRRRYGDRGNLRFMLGDVRDRSSVDRAMSGVDLVFHAAALKQVPSCEFFPQEAVATNVGGSANVIESASAHGVSSVVLLSTDKAVYPINAMGMTKALMEKIGQAAARELLRDGAETRVMITRYGNVLYSRGSVIPTFVEQLREGRPLGITDPGMTRFLLPLAGAVALVEHAWHNGGNGDVFVRKAPACTLGDLALAIQNVFDRHVGVDRIGIRHGEKIFETLVTSAELARADSSEEYFRIPMDDRELGYAEYFEHGDPTAPAYEDYDSHNTTRLDVAAIENLLHELPEIQAELARW